MRLFVLLVILFALFLEPVSAGDYVIGDGDLLEVSVWGVPELSVTVRVRPDGKITLPAAGDVDASGYTPSQLSEKLSKVLGRLVKEPIVTLSVVEMTNNKVYVFGGGVPSSVLNLTGRTSLFKVLCQLENIDDTDLKNAYLMRDNKKLLTDFYPLFVGGQLDDDVVLQAEDVLFIPSNEVFVVGEVREPRYVFYRDGLKVMDAILEAGGFSEFADQDDVTIVRADSSKLDVKIDRLLRGKDIAQNYQLLPGDYVIVSESLF